MQNEQATSTVIVNGEQAKQEMTALEQKARSLKEQLIQANKAGDGKAYDKLSRELKKTQKEMRQLHKESFDVKRVLDNLSGASMKDLESAQKRLNAQLRSGDIKRNSKEWRENVEAQKRVKAEIKAINAEMQVGESRLSKFANGFNKYFSSIAAGFAALAGVTLSLKKYSDNRIQLEDSKANLEALTGLSKEDINWLTMQAREMSTQAAANGIRIRQSSTEIVDAYTLVGSAKPELLENRDALKEVTQQTLILAAASKMDLKDAVNGITMAMNQYSARAEEAARYTNVLAAGSKYGAANVESQTSAIIKSGVAAAQANIQIESLVGTIQTLAEKGIKDEIAGTGLKKFFLTLQTGADETNPKVVGLDKALENLAAKQLSAAEIKKMFGEEGYNVAAVLLAETERVKYFTQAVTDSNVALEQATINSDTMAAKLAQAKNKLNEAGMEFVGKLNPAILTATNFGTKFIKVLMQIPKFFRENWMIITALVAIWTTYSIILNASIIADKLKVFWTDKLTLSLKKLWITIKANPWGLILTAITLASVGIFKWITYQNEAEKAMSDFNKEAYKQQTELNNIFEAYKKANEGTAEKNRLLKLIKEKYGTYIGHLIDEKGRITDIEEAQKLANKALREQIALKMQNSLIDEVTNKEIQSQADIIEKIRKKITSKKGQSLGNVIVDEITDVFKNNTEDLVSATKEAFKVLDKYDLRDNVIDKRDLSMDINSLFSSMYRLDTKTKQIKQNFKSLIGDAENFDISSGSGADEPKTGDEKIINGTLMRWDGKKWVKVQVENNSDPDKAFKDQQSQIEKKYKSNLLMLTRMYQEKLLNQKLYEQLSEENEIVFLEDKLKLQEKFNKDTVDAEIDLINAKIKIDQNDLKRAEEHKKMIESMKLKQSFEVAEDDPIIDTTKYTLATRLAIIEAFHQKGLLSEREYLQKLADLYKGNQQEINNYLKDQNLKNTQAEYDAGIIGRKQYLENIRNITRSYWEEIFADQHELANKILAVANKATDFVKNLAEAETIAIENKYAKQLDAARKAGTDTTKLEEKIEEEKKQVKKKYADIDFAITVAKIISETALAIMEAAPNIPLQIISGLAGAAQLAIAAEQRNSVRNLWTGGFTDPGGKYEPRGIVHAGEFVANQDAVNNRTLRKLFNLIDYAQRTNTVARIDKDLITQTLHDRGFSSGGFTSNSHERPSSKANDYNFDPLIGMLSENKTLIVLLISILKKGIKADVSVTGKGGIKEATDLYDKLIK